MNQNSKPRRRGRRLLYGAAALVLLLLILGWVASALVDPEAYRGRIESALTDATGWSAEIGEIDFSLWRGALTVAPARLQDPSGDSYVEVERISIRVALPRLLRGTLAIRSVTLQRPQVQLVKIAGDQEWALPGSQQAPTPATQADDTTSPSDGSAEIPAAATGGGPTIGVVRLVDGQLILDDRSSTPAIRKTLEDLQLEWTADNGQLKGSMALDDMQLESTFQIDWPAGVSGTIDIQGLKILDGIKPLDNAHVEFSLAIEGENWRLDQLLVEGAGAQIVGGGSLQPKLALELNLVDAPLEALLRWSDAVMPLPVPVSPPGTMDAGLEILQLDNGEFAMSGKGRMTTAQVALGAPLPALADIEIEFGLDADGRLRVDILESTMGDGQLRGKANLDTISPPGMLTFDGEVKNGVLGKLIGGFIADPDSTIVGNTELETKIGLDLSGEIDASALQGGLSMESTGVDLPGWDFEAAIRESLETKLSSLGGLAALLDDGDVPAEAADPPPGDDGPLIDRLAAEISFDSMPWKIERLLLLAGDLESEGQGSFDPIQDHLDLTIIARFSPERSARWVAEQSLLSSLQDADGRIAIPVVVQGSVGAPDVSVDISELKRSRGKRLKKKLLNRLLRKN